MRKGIYGTRGDLFTSVEVGKVKRSGFDLSHDIKMSFDVGNLTPCFFQEVLPGDKWNVNENVLLRFAPLAAPVMHKMDVYTHFFKVPYRLLMNPGDFDAFITGGEKGDGKNDIGEFVTMPSFKVSDIHAIITKSPFNLGAMDAALVFFECFSPGSLLDYLGYPTLLMTTDQVDDAFGGWDVAYTHVSRFLADAKNQLDLSIYPIRAYIKIYNEYYRDQNLVGKLREYTDYFVLPEEIIQFVYICSPRFRELCINLSGDICDFDFSELGNSKMLHRAWKKDYFTSALPFAQKGEAVTLGIGGSAPVTGAIQNRERLGATKLIDIKSGASLTGNIESYETILPEIEVQEGQLTADLSAASAVTLEQLRTAQAVQIWLEKLARVGARYTEMLQGFFGVTPRDSRLQRPEYLGGGKTPVIISEVMQTSQNQPGAPLGDVAGKAISLGNFHGFNTFVEEYGVIIGIVSVLPSSSYMQSVSRTLFSRTREEMYFPQFAHLGEQEVKNAEVCFNFGLGADGGVDDSDRGLTETFGYQSRYAEYKYIPDRVHGDFKTNGLDQWHLARRFNRIPGLDAEFVSCDPAECNRIFNVQSSLNEQRIWSQLYFDAKVIRCMPKYGTPAFGL